MTASRGVIAPPQGDHVYASMRKRRSSISAIASAVITAGLLVAAPMASAAASVDAASVVTPMASTLSKTPVPTIVGTAAVGSGLTAKAGSWNPGVALKYQWYATGMVIRGAASSKFTPTTAQVGKKITVKVTGSKSGYTSVSKTSAATKTIPALRLKTGAVTIAGKVAVGQKLTAKPGTWTSGTTLKYQWYVGGKAVSKSIWSTFTLRPGDADRAVTVKVTGSKTGYTTKTVSSASTKKVVGKYYANCTLLKKDYPDGIRKSTAKGDMKSGKLKPFVGKPFVSNTLYGLQSIARDADRDGIMCER